LIFADDGYKAQWGYYTDGETGVLLLTYRFFDLPTARFLTRYRAYCPLDENR